MWVVDQSLGKIARIYPESSGRRYEVVEGGLSSFLGPKLNIVGVLHREALFRDDVTDIGIVIQLVAGLKDGGGKAIDRGQHEEQ